MCGCLFIRLSDTHKPFMSFFQSYSRSMYFSYCTSKKNFSTSASSHDFLKKKLPLKKIQKIIKKVSEKRERKREREMSTFYGDSSSSNKKRRRHFRCVWGRGETLTVFGGAKATEHELASIESRLYVFFYFFKNSHSNLLNKLHKLHIHTLHPSPCIYL